MEKKKTVLLDDIMAAKNKSCGVNTVTTGKSIIYNPFRVSFGVFPLDYCLGGGIPLWGSTCLWGPKGGAKSTLAIKAIKMCSIMCWRCFNLLDYCTCSTHPLKMKAAVGDIEGTLDIAWMESMGVSKEDYYLILGDSAEQYFDIMEACLEADDCGLVVGDSLGGITPEAEMDKSLLDSNMGKQPALVTKIVRKLKQRLIREKKRLHPCTVLYTNQMRSDLGKIFGSKESIPGGHASMHEYSVVLRCVKRALTEADKKKFVDDDRQIQVASRQAVTVRNSKVFTIAGSTEFILIKEKIDLLALKKGEVDDYKAVINYGRDLGIIEQKGNYYTIPACKKVKFDTLTKLRDYFKSNRIVYLKVQQDIIKKAKEHLLGAKK